MTFLSGVQGLPCGGQSVNPIQIPTYFLDYDRDGKDDVLVRCYDGSIAVSLSRGDGDFIHLGDIGTQLPDSDARDTRNGVLPLPIVYDIDGDALQDIVSCATDELSRSGAGSARRRASWSRYACSPRPSPSRAPGGFRSVSRARGSRT